MKLFITNILTTIKSGVFFEIIFYRRHVAVVITSLVWKEVLTRWNVFTEANVRWRLYTIFDIKTLLENSGFCERGPLYKCPQYRLLFGKELVVPPGRKKKKRKKKKHYENTRAMSDKHFNDNHIHQSEETLTHEKHKPWTTRPNGTLSRQHW